MTLDTYADLFDDDLGAIAVALTRVRAVDLTGRNKDVLP